MQSPCLHAPRGHPFPGSTFLHAGSVIVGFRAAQSEPPESPSPWRGAAGSNRGNHLAGGGGGGGGESARPHSLLSDLLRDVQRAAAEADALMADALAYEVDDDDDEDDDGEDDLDDDELDLLEALNAAWGSPSSSVFSAATGASRASTASSSRPIAIPAASYFKDQTQRAHLEKLNKKRQVRGGVSRGGGGGGLAEGCRFRADTAGFVWFDRVGFCSRLVAVGCLLLKGMDSRG